MLVPFILCICVAIITHITYKIGFKNGFTSGYIKAMSEYEIFDYKEE